MLTTQDLLLHWWGRNRKQEFGEQREANGERLAPIEGNLSIEDVLPRI